MKTRALVVVLCALLVGGVLPTSADTHAPSLQFGIFDCNGETRMMVSPGFNAKAGQDLGSTSVGVAFLISFGNEVLYQSPAFPQLQGLLETCTTEGLTFYFLVPPLDQPSR
jgi:hypothetical protein